MSILNKNEEINLTDKAKKEITRIMQQNDIPLENYLRIFVKGGGCSGLTYQLGFDAHKKDGDSVFDYGNLKLVVDGKSIFYLSGTTLDFSDGLNGKGFIFENPHAKRTCGCGDSFSV